MCTRVDLQVWLPYCMRDRTSILIICLTVRFSQLPLLQSGKSIHHPALCRSSEKVRLGNALETHLRRAILLHAGLLKTEYETAQGSAA